MNHDTSVVLNMGADTTDSSKYCKNFKERKSKRYRSAFTTEQINYLEGQFKNFSYIGRDKRKEVANTLKISERAVKIWFQNRRMKEKRENNNSTDIQIEYKNHANNNSNKLLTSNNVYLSDCAVNEQLLRSECQNEHLKGINSKGIKPNKKNKINEFQDKYANNVYLSENKCNSKTIDKKTLYEYEDIEAQKPISITNNSAIAFINEGLDHFNDVSQELKDETTSSTLILGEKDDFTKDVSLSNNIQADRRVYQEFYPEHLNCDQKLIPLFNHGYYVSQPVPPTPANHSGNVVWKPVSVMPVLPGIGPASNVTGDNNNTMYLNNVSKGVCNCHSTQNSSNAGMQYVSRTHPQYVFAIPFCNSPN